MIADGRSCPNQSVTSKATAQRRAKCSSPTSMVKGLWRGYQLLWRHFSGNLVSSSNGFKVIGVTGSVVSDIEDLVVAKVIPGLGKDMPTVKVNKPIKDGGSTAGLPPCNKPKDQQSN